MVSARPLFVKACVPAGGWRGAVTAGPAGSVAHRGQVGWFQASGTIRVCAGGAPSPRGPPASVVSRTAGRWGWFQASGTIRVCAGGSGCARAGRRHRGARRQRRARRAGGDGSRQAERSGCARAGVGPAGQPSVETHGDLVVPGVPWAGSGLSVCAKRPAGVPRPAMVTGWRVPVDTGCRWTEGGDGDRLEGAGGPTCLPTPDKNARARQRRQIPQNRMSRAALSR